MRRRAAPGDLVRVLPLHDDIQGRFPPDAAGVCSGTDTGSVLASVDEGENWAKIACHLPTLLSVETPERP